jgi:hypothetical protein
MRQEGSHPRGRTTLGLKPTGGTDYWGPTNFRRRATFSSSNARTRVRNFSTSVSRSSTCFSNRST